MMHIWILLPVILEAVSPLLAIEVNCQPTSLQMPVGHNTSLRCFWKYESKCAAEKIIWTKDGHVLQSHPPLKNQNNQTVNSRFQFMYYNVENGNISVDIENLQNSDEGNYSCIIIINGAYGQGTINLQVSDPEEKHEKDDTEQTDPIQKLNINLNNSSKHYDALNPKEEQEINLMALGFGVGAAALVSVIIGVAFVLWKTRLGYSHCQKKEKLPYTELIKKPLNHDGTEKSVNLAITQPPFRSQSQAWINGEGRCEEKYPAI